MTAPPDAPQLPPEPGPDAVVPLPIQGVLDLHTFPPQVVGDLVRDYLEACRRQGQLEVRLIHGKGRGHLRRSVHALLARHPAVARWAEAGPHFGGAGATWVWLKAPEPPSGADAGSGLLEGPSPPCA